MDGRAESQAQVKVSSICCCPLLHQAHHLEEAGRLIECVFPFINPRLLPVTFLWSLYLDVSSGRLFSTTSQVQR